MQAFLLLLLLLISIASPLISFRLGLPGARSVLCTPTRLSANAVDAATLEFEKSWQKSGGIEVYSGVRHEIFSAQCNSELKGLCAASRGGMTKAGEQVVKAPRTSVLAVIDSDPCPIKGIEQEQWKKMKLTTRLSILLLIEYKKQEGSQFFNYIAQLPPPSSLQSPLHWSPSALARLEKAYPPLAKAVQKQRDDYGKLFSLFSSSPEGISVDYDRFVWALEIVRSRAFEGLGGMERPSDFFLRAAFAAALMGAAVVTATTNGGGEVIPAILATIASASLLPFVFNAQKSSCVLLPGIDSANHSSQELNCQIEFEPGQDAFTMRTTCPIAEGSEILISYGKRDNDDLLQFFGFVETKNYFDRYIVEQERAGTVTPIVVNRQSKDTWVLPDDLKQPEGLKVILTSELSSLDACLSLPMDTISEDYASCLLRSFLVSKRDTLLTALGKL